MIDWLLKLIPAEYKWQVAVKKVTYFAGKGAAALLTYGAVGKYVGSHLTPDQMTQVQSTAALVVGGALEGLHDFLKMKYPNANWL